MARRLRPFTSDKRGASAVEFAIIAPFLLVLVAAIIAYGALFATTLSLQQLGAEAARATIAGLTDNERESLAQVRINELAANYPMLRADRLSFDFVDGGGNSTVRLSYVVTDHPAYVLEGLIPLPKSPLVYTMAVTDGDGTGL